MGSSEVQGRLWGAAPQDWLENEPFSVPLYEAVFAALAIGDGLRLLDAGCGAGLALQMAAARGATVSGIDAAEALLEVARERVPDADLRHGDLEDLPFADDAFDVTTSFNAVQYAADPEVALGEIRRVVRPGGAVAIITWGDPERCDTRAVLTAVGRLLPPPPPGAVGPFALSAPSKLEEFAASAGLRAERAAEVPAPFSFASLDDAVRIQLSAGPLQRAVEHAGEEATRQALRDAFAPFVRADGSIHQENFFRYLIARA